MKKQRKEELLKDLGSCFDLLEEINRGMNRKIDCENEKNHKFLAQYYPFYYHYVLKPSIAANSRNHSNALEKETTRQDFFQFENKKGESNAYRIV